MKWNHLSGTATVYNTGRGAYEYNAYAFFVPTGLDQEPVGVAGALNLNGVEYDSCPLYQIGQFTPAGARAAGALRFDPSSNRLALAGCTLEPAAGLGAGLHEAAVRRLERGRGQVHGRVRVRRQLARDCSFDDDIDSAAQNFEFATLGTFAARYRVQGVKSTQCETSGPRHAGRGRPRRAVRLRVRLAFTEATRSARRWRPPASSRARSRGIPRARCRRGHPVTRRDQGQRAKGRGIGG